MCIDLIVLLTTDSFAIVKPFQRFYSGLDKAIYPLMEHSPGKAKHLSLSLLKFLFPRMTQQISLWLTQDDLLVKEGPPQGLKG